MENIRRKLKLFWVEHSDPIIFYTILILGVIIVVNFLDYLAIVNQNKEKEYMNSSITVENINYYEKEKKEIKIIEEFIEYCENKEIDKAYTMLSETCKEYLYPTKEEFEYKYYNMMFRNNYDIEIKYNSTNNLYEIYFYEDMLESGKVENRENIINYYKLEIDDKKIYINYEIK